MTSEDLRQYARELVADWPPLTEYQKAVIIAMFRTPRECRRESA